MSAPEIRLQSYTSRLDFLLKQCSSQKVLNLGCSTGTYFHDRLEKSSLLHTQLNDVVSELYGIDINGDNLMEMDEAFGYTNLYEGNVETLDDIELDETFDVVVADDIIEHFTCPGAMLNGVKRFLNNNGKLLISSNNVFGLNYQIRRWTGNFHEHFDHVCFYSPETLMHLLKRHGFNVIAMHGAFSEPPGTLSQKIKFAIGSPIYKLFPILAGTLLVVAELE